MACQEAAEAGPTAAAQCARCSACSNDNGGSRRCQASSVAGESDMQSFVLPPKGGGV